MQDTLVKINKTNKFRLIMKNCTNPKIPDTDYLIEKAEELFSKVSRNKMFMFSDFFELKNGEYCRNKPLIEERGGLYIFYEGTKPVYVGISRKVVKRVKQHMCGKRHNEASLAYLIAKEKSGFGGERKDMKDNEEFQQIKRKMREEWKIRIIEVDDPYVRYFSEIYFAAKLKTCWNDFETH